MCRFCEERQGVRYSCIGLRPAGVPGCGDRRRPAARIREIQDKYGDIFVPREKVRELRDLFHQLQAALIGALSRNGRRPECGFCTCLVLFMLDPGKKAGLDLKTEDPDEDEVRPSVPRINLAHVWLVPRLAVERLR